MLIQPVLLSGGAGSRLWPLSSADRPKQFLALFGSKTMFELTADRVADPGLFAPALVVGSSAHEEILTELLGSLMMGDATLILEPAGRNTAAAIGLAALAAEPETLLLIMPSDHMVADVPAFHAAIAAAVPCADDGWIVTFGLEPTSPETGYGYIEQGSRLTNKVYRAARFVEKPDATTAMTYLRSGRFLWNGGIFLVRASTVIDALATLAPEVMPQVTKAYVEAVRRGRTLHPDAAAFSAVRSISFDHAVMEHFSRVAVVPVDMGWSDVGNWDALYRLCPTDDNRNALDNNSMAIGSTGLLVRAQDMRVTCIGVHDLTVVVAGGHVLISGRGSGELVGDAARAAYDAQGAS